MINNKTEFQYFIDLINLQYKEKSNGTKNWSFIDIDKVIYYNLQCLYDLHLNK